ncbi:hypothetical protein TEA_009731 [Camellia sinensis var. sinensis]|uniref:Protein kinase domain-containing protein n=1 Tax=Camellia sinensis var. sinensis TaxID=542762 RepID=A0A4S4ERS0_CAMSN|nr:hypothetical protein TEA_009731 [Camellia sinensis var. sinensis]
MVSRIFRVAVMEIGVLGFCFRVVMLGKRRMSTQVLVAIVVSIGGSVLLVILGFCLVYRKRMKKYNVIESDMIGTEISAVQSLQFDLATIQVATNNFSDDNKIGEGGFGSVYKWISYVDGIFSNGQEITVKRLSRNSGQGAEEFKNEVVLVAKLQHRNLVRSTRRRKVGLGKTLQDYRRNSSRDALSS